jgi:hypothetical protein
LHTKADSLAKEQASLSDQYHLKTLEAERLASELRHVKAECATKMQMQEDQAQLLRLQVEAKDQESKRLHQELAQVRKGREDRAA